MHMLRFFLVLICLSLARSQEYSSCIFGLIYNVSIVLPPAQPNSPGDINLLQPNNMIVWANGSALTAGEGMK
jgi:hypothetical protein